MKKKIILTNTASSSSVGGAPISRFLPNRSTPAVGPFILLDQAGPLKINSSEAGGTGPHPHRGIATLTYAISGEIEHFDSLGNNAVVSSGGVQWMNSGNGIVHNERSKASGNNIQKSIYAFQFWINLPSKIKAEKPAYLPVQANEVPEKLLPADAGIIRVIAGEYEDLKSKIPSYTAQFLYHIKIKKGKKVSLNFLENFEVAAVLPTDSAILNSQNFKAGEMIIFDKEAGEIKIENSSDIVLDVLLFGGEEYLEPVVSQGPFVMNSEEEIALAYQDYQAGKYGEIQYL